MKLPMAVFERLIWSYFADQGSRSKLKTADLDAIERLGDTNSALRITGIGDRFFATRTMTFSMIDEQDNAIHPEDSDVMKVLQKAMRASTVINLTEAPRVP